MYIHCSHSSSWPFSPPENLKVKKKQSLSEKILTYFTYILLHFLSYFLSSVLPEKKKKSLSDLVNNFFIISKHYFIQKHYFMQNLMLLYIVTCLPWGSGSCSCEYFQNNGVIWCIDV